MIQIAHRIRKDKGKKIMISSHECHFPCDWSFSRSNVHNGTGLDNLQNWLEKKERKTFHLSDKTPEGIFLMGCRLTIWLISNGFFDKFYNIFGNSLPLLAQFKGLAESLTNIFRNTLFNVFHDILSKMYNEYIFPVLRQLK